MPAVETSHLSPSTRPEVIQQLIDGVDRYNPDNVSILEEYLTTQCQNEEYDLMANLAILKLYQFNPHLTNDQVVINILVKALTVIPEPDFNLCLFLLNETVVSEEAISKLTELQQLLESARYEKFWETYEGDDIYKELISEVVGFDKAVREVIVRTVQMTYQTISSQLLRSYLNLSAQDFAQFCLARGWTESDGVVSLQLNKDNEVKTVIIRENIKFEQLTKIIGYSNEL
ncbi:uncharacterized protein VTP21DRAFT_5941 [Calcarisporiella thermophila]|uniref:uncharacterized protein n=1 Tax=Calcarisporiella thermophila TaxID=911321 RepID=UPI003742E888